MQKRFDIGWQRSQFLLHYLNMRTRDAETFTVITTSLVAIKLMMKEVRQYNFLKKYNIWGGLSFSILVRVVKLTVVSKFTYNECLLKKQ